MRIGLDAMGGDHGLPETVAGAVEAARVYQIPVTLFGPRDQIETYLAKLDVRNLDIQITDAKEVIETDDSPVRALRQKKDSSLVKGLEALRDGEIDAFVSAGNTGALVSGGIMIVGMMKGLRRPGLATLMPTLKKRPIVLVDAGASVDPKPEQLAEYAVVGSIYAEEILKYANPKVGLINIGVEEGKGNELMRQAHVLLKKAPIRFIGNIEARDLVSGDVEVVVADGFVGNVLLKLAEGLGLGMFRLIQAEMRQTVWTKLGGLLVRPRLRKLRSLMDYSEYGGAPLFGPKSPIIKCHGSSKAEAFKNGIRVGSEFARLEIMATVEKRLQELENHG